MNRQDRALLIALQRDSRRSVAELGEAVGLSGSACHRRVRQLEAQGYILGYGARLDPSRLGYGLIAHVEISLTGQSRESMDRFEEAVGRFEDILECDLMSGSADYLLRVAARDIGDFDRIHRECLSRLPGVAAMKTSFAIRRVKSWTGYPVPDGA